jgi:Tfp pilus assembly protein PilE
MKNLQKGSALIALLIIVAVIAIGSGVYYYSKNTPSIKDKIDTQATTNVATTANEFVSKEYGFKFSYPALFASSTEEYPRGNKQCEKFNVGEKLYFNAVSLVSLNNIEVVVICEPLTQELVNSRRSFAASIMPNGKLTTITVDSKKAYQRDFEQLGYVWRIVQIPIDDSHFVELSYSYYTHADGSPENLWSDSLTTILSSFKFTK